MKSRKVMGQEKVRRGSKWDEFDIEDQEGVERCFCHLGQETTAAHTLTHTFTQLLQLYPVTLNVYELRQRSCVAPHPSNTVCLCVSSCFFFLKTF